MINADGTRQQSLDPSLGTVSGDLDWSPDASELVLTSDRFGDAENFLENMERFVVESDGTRLRRITSNQWMDAHPDW